MREVVEVVLTLNLLFFNMSYLLIQQNLLTDSVEEILCVCERRDKTSF